MTHLRLVQAGNFGHSVVATKDEDIRCPSGVDIAADELLERDHELAVHVEDVPSHRSSTTRTPRPTSTHPVIRSSQVRTRGRARTRPSAPTPSEKARHQTTAMTRNVTARKPVVRN